MVRALLRPMAQLRSAAWLRGSNETPQFDNAGLHAALNRAGELAESLARVRTTDPLLVPEYELAVAMWQHGCKRLLKAQDDNAYSSAELSAEIRPILGTFAARWLARSRPGGLGDSLTRLARLLAEYEA
jgi:hypothetical protein